MTRQLAFRLALFLLLVMMSLNRVSLLALNLGTVDLLRAALVSSQYSPTAQTWLQSASQSHQRAYWPLSRLAEWRGEWEERDSYLARLLVDCSYLNLMYATYPLDVELAQQATEACPDSSVAAFWLGELLVTTDIDEAIRWYEQGLTRSPKNGTRWVELGGLSHRVGELEQALLAYRKGCELWDKGRNGCLRAARLADELGWYEGAIEFYERALQQLPEYGPALERLPELKEERESQK